MIIDHAVDITRLTDNLKSDNERVVIDALMGLESVAFSSSEFLALCSSLP